MPSTYGPSLIALLLFARALSAGAGRRMGRRPGTPAARLARHPVHAGAHRGTSRSSFSRGFPYQEARIAAHRPSAFVGLRRHACLTGSVPTDDLGAAGGCAVVNRTRLPLPRMPLRGPRTRRARTVPPRTP